MSATRDKSQKITFVYSNLYAIYRKGIERAREGALKESDENSPSRAAQALSELALGTPGLKTGAVIKSAELRNQVNPGGHPSQASTPKPAARIQPYTPAELVGRRVARPASLPNQAQPEAVQSLKQNLQSLNDLQARLRFMLKELEELIKE